MPILDYFSHPSSQPRQVQVDILKWAEENKDKKYLIIELPVGGGKSHVGVTYARWKRATEGTELAGFLMTPQRILQKQYEDTFISGRQTTDVATFYGKGNYECKGKNTTCDIGGLTKPACQQCPHKAAMLRAQQSAMVVLNYHLGFILFGSDKVFGKRPLMVFDEAHNVESIVVEMGKLNISRHFCLNKLGINVAEFPSADYDAEYALAFVEQLYLPALDNWLSEQAELLQEKVSTNSIGSKEAKMLRELEDLGAQYETLKIMVEQGEYDDGHWVYVTSQIPNSEHGELYSFGFKPTTAANLFNGMVADKADQFIFMSSTILDHKGFCRDLGIDHKQAAFFRAESPFDPENRKIKYIPLGLVNNAWFTKANKDNRDQYIDNLMAILLEHAKDSGVIHTASYAMARWLVKELNSQPEMKHAIFHHNPSMNTGVVEDGADSEVIGRDAAIASYLQSAKRRPSILISPSCTEGLDLVGDLGRFSIIAKIPFGYLGDNWIRNRMNMSPDWYARQAIIGVIQASGRVVRNESDWGTTYIVDQAWSRLVKNNREMIPNWWMDAYEH